MTEPAKQEQAGRRKEEESRWGKAKHSEERLAQRNGSDNQRDVLHLTLEDDLRGSRTHFLGQRKRRATLTPSKALRMPKGASEETLPLWQGLFYRVTSQRPEQGAKSIFHHVNGALLGRQSEDNLPQ